MSQLTSYHTFLLICLLYLYVLVLLVVFYIMYGLLQMSHTLYINGTEAQDRQMKIHSVYFLSLYNIYLPSHYKNIYHIPRVR